MNKAEQSVAAFESEYMTYSEVSEEAFATGNVFESDQNAECTWIEFADGSVVLFSGVEQKLYAYGSKD